MENIYDIMQERQVISNFLSIQQDDLGRLISELHLNMTVRDLRYCQNQYRMRERRSPTVEELRFLDALYATRTNKIEYHGLRSFYTSDSMLAATYADMIAKANRVRQDERPYTPAELSGILTKTLVQTGKKISVPSLCIGQDAPLRALKYGRTETGCAVLHGVPAIIGEKNTDLPAAKTKAQPTDHILLLTPAGLSAVTFATLIASLSLPTDAQIVPIGETGLLEALLGFDGVYLVMDYLPGLDGGSPLSSLLSAFTDGILIRIDGDMALDIRDRAARAGLTASIIGKCAINHQLTIRREGQSPVQFETAFLRAFSPTLPADAEIPGVGSRNDIHVTTQLPQTVLSGGDCALFAANLPNTPYVIQNDHILTGAVSYPSNSTFLSSMFTTLHAVNRAVAAGADYETLTLSNQITSPTVSDSVNFAAGELMASLLGAYRVQAELALPDVGGRFYRGEEGDNKAHLLVFTAAPKPEKPVGHTFTTAGNNVYLLTPLMNEETLIDFEDYRKLLRYVHHLCREGIACSAIAVDAGGAYTALKTMTQSGYGFLAASSIPATTCGFLIETHEVIQGTLLGVTTAPPTIRIDEEETPILHYRLPKLTANQIPMSDIGVECPILCVAETPALGCTLPIRHLAEQHHAILKTVPATQFGSRSQMTALANAMLEAHITVLVGSTEELSTILAHPRVAYAKNNLLSHDGLLLCLHTDPDKLKNAPIPKNHPFFYGTPETFFELSGIRFEGEQGQIVHMRSDSVAIPRMLACALAYYQ